VTRSNQSTRREFLRQAAAAGAVISAPLVVPASALGLQGTTAPSERIVMGSIGTGGMGRGNTNTFMNQPDVQLVAVCDVDTNHRNQARDLVNNKYGNKDCAAYNDFRELLARKDIDAVMIATPDHWHALCSIAAANAGKDMYTEKPLANSIGEGRAVANAVKKNKRILQTGSHERSGSNARFACELVRNGYVGKLHTIEINLPDNDGHHNQAKELTSTPPEEKIPEGFDYDLWLGHTAKAPYTSKRTHFWWRFVLAYGGGEMTDRGAHVIDIAQLGAGMDDSGPVEIDARGRKTPGSLYDVYWDYEFVNVYPNGVKMIGSTKGPRGVKFIGDEGWVFVHIHGQRLEAEPALLLQVKIPETAAVQLGRSPGHHRNFLDSVKSRKDPVATAEIGHRTASVCHLNNIAMAVGHKVKWDPAKEHFIDDEKANSLVTPSMRSPWSL
jgi:predicted dehydrogenase